MCEACLLFLCNSKSQSYQQKINGSAVCPLVSCGSSHRRFLLLLLLLQQQSKPTAAADSAAAAAAAAADEADYAPHTAALAWTIHKGAGSHSRSNVSCNVQQQLLLLPLLMLPLLLLPVYFGFALLLFVSLR